MLEKSLIRIVFGRVPDIRKQNVCSIFILHPNSPYVRMRKAKHDADKNQEGQDRNLFSYIKGTLEEYWEDTIVVESGGIGLEHSCSAVGSGPASACG